MTIKLNGYGFEIDADWAYVALSWQILITTALLVVAYKVYKWKRGK